MIPHAIPRACVVALNPGFAVRRLKSKTFKVEDYDVLAWFIREDGTAHPITTEHPANGPEHASGLRHPDGHVTEAGERYDDTESWIHANGFSTTDVIRGA